MKSKRYITDQIASNSKGNKVRGIDNVHVSETLIDYIRLEIWDQFFSIHLVTLVSFERCDTGNKIHWILVFSD